ncbi:hypothetical protein [Streptomyces griseus]|uniref:hypothetical protein n=1 Tax=Streptomyces griseus TaxID=1911 RepID=UPI001F3C8FF3|nr:hypothetical protein [Streptomyces griseus]
MALPLTDVLLGCLPAVLPGHRGLLTSWRSTGPTGPRGAASASPPPVDAYAAARAALSGRASSAPKDDTVTGIRALQTAERAALENPTVAMATPVQPTSRRER